MMFESDKADVDRFLAAGHEPALNGVGEVDNEFLDERGVERFGVRCRNCGYGLDLGGGVAHLETVPACDGAEGLVRRLRARRNHYERLAADLDI